MRYARPFDGSWQGASGASACRVADISLGGCFIHSLAMPATGEATVVTVSFGDHSVSFSGRVAYVDAGMGFAVEFTDVPETDRAELERRLRSLDPGRATAG